MLTGARQIGKTYSIRRFGHEHFERFIEINFIENPGLVKVFSKAKNSQDILLRLSTVTSQDLIKGSTLVFFDEVQEWPGNRNCHQISGGRGGLSLCFKR